MVTSKQLNMLVLGNAFCLVNVERVLLKVHESEIETMKQLIIIKNIIVTVFAWDLKSNRKKKKRTRSDSSEVENTIDEHFLQTAQKNLFF